MKSINQIDFSEKKAFVRVDFNVPFDDAGQISDNSRIVRNLTSLVKRNIKINTNECCFHRKIDVMY